MLLCLRKRCINVFFLLYTDSVCSIAFCQFHEIRNIFRTLVIWSLASTRTGWTPAQTGRTVTLSIKQFLHLADHTKIIIVQQTDRNSGTLCYRRCHLLNIHLKSAISRDTHDRFLWICNFCPDCGRKSESHRSQSAGCDELTLFVQFQILASGFSFSHL